MRTDDLRADPSHGDVRFYPDDARRLVLRDHGLRADGARTARERELVAEVDAELCAASVRHVMEARPNE